MTDKSDLDWTEPRSRRGFHDPCEKIGDEGLFSPNDFFSKAKLTTRVIRFVARWIGGLILILGFSKYLVDAQERSKGEPDCVWEAVLNYQNVPYSAQWCRLNREKVLLRLFDVEERQLLAERTFFQRDWPNFYWKLDAIGYDTEPHGGLIALPPSVLDRWRAKLP